MKTYLYQRIRDFLLVILAFLKKLVCGRNPLVEKEHFGSFLWDITQAKFVTTIEEALEVVWMYYDCVWYLPERFQTKEVILHSLERWPGSYKKIKPHQVTLQIAEKGAFKNCRFFLSNTS